MHDRELFMLLAATVFTAKKFLFRLNVIILIALLKRLEIASGIISYMRCFASHPTRIHSVGITTSYTMPS